VLEIKDPNRPSGYADVLQNLIHNLHFGNYGGLEISELTCFHSFLVIVVKGRINGIRIFFPQVATDNIFSFSSQ